MQQFTFWGHFADPEFPAVRCEPGESRWGVPKPIIFVVDNGTSVLRQEVLYSSLTLLKMIREYSFETVLDIGSHAGNVARVLSHLGKRVTTCEVSPGYQADYKQDFIEIDFPHKFDAIWCSQVLEHQRNVGFFLNKIFNDLKDGGVLALTVPCDVRATLDFGHCNIFHPLLLVYHLVMAGFDCRDACVFLCDDTVGLLVQKRYNGIDQSLPHGTLAPTENTDSIVEVNGRTMSVRELLGKEIFDRMNECFPGDMVLQHSSNAWPGPGVNFRYPPTGV